MHECIVQMKEGARIVNMTEDASSHIANMTEDASSHIANMTEDASRHIVNMTEDASSHLVNMTECLNIVDISSPEPFESNNFSRHH